MLRWLSRPAVRLVERYLPDPYIFVLLLTLVAGTAATLATPHTPREIVQLWGDGFWDLLGFSMQMLLVLISGFMLAHSPPVARVLDALAGRVRSAGGAIVTVTLVSLAASWLNQGLPTLHTSPRQALFCGKMRRSARRAVTLRKRARTLDCRKTALGPPGWAANRALPRCES